MFSTNHILTSIEKGDLRELTKNLLRTLGVKPSRRRGQNFTTDPRLLKEFREAVSRLGCLDTVVEVGSGLGYLTLYLADICERIISIEIDPRLCRFVKELFREKSNVEILCGDAIEIIRDINFRGVVGTIPYSVTGALIGALIRSRASWAVIALQKDVIDRIISEPGSRRYGSVSVATQLYFDIELGGVYPPNSFYPEPEVFTQIIIMRRRNEPEEYLDDFERFLKCLFSQRKKILSNALRICCGDDFKDLVPSHMLGERVYELGPEEIKELYLRLINKC